jgi:hypothetical protein
MIPETKQHQPFKIHLHPNGDLKIEGSPQTPEQLELAQQVVDESHFRAKAYEKVNNLTKWESFYQGIIAFSLFMLLLITVSFVAVRTISNLFAHTQESSNAR